MPPAEAATTAAPAENEDETVAPTPSIADHPLYQLTDRNNLQGLISPTQLVDRSGIVKALPTEQKSDLFIGYSGGQLMSSFFVDIENGFIDQCEKYGYKHSELYVESRGDTAGQFTNVDTLIAQGVNGIVLSGDGDAISTMSKLCGILTGMIESVTKLQGNPISFEDAAYASNDYITKLALDGTLEVPEINMSIKGYGEGMWVTADALNAAEDLFTATPDMQLMMCDNDYMAIGGILAAQAIGINIGTDCFFFACSDGTMVALEYVRDGLMLCTGVNCAYALGWGNVEVFHMVYEEGFDASDMPNQTLVDSIPLSAENFDKYYDPSIELVRETTIEFLTTQEKLATYGL